MAEPLITWESLLKPIEPPRQLDTALPAHVRLKAELNRAASLLNAMAMMADAAPFDDSAFESLDNEYGKAMQQALEALRCFRDVRDCRGSA